MNKAVKTGVMRFMPFSVPQSWPGNNPSEALSPWRQNKTCRQKIHPFFLVVVTLTFQLLQD